MMDDSRQSFWWQEFLVIMLLLEVYFKGYGCFLDFVWGPGCRKCSENVGPTDNLL